MPGDTFGVKVSIPETYPTTVSAFATKADAKAWIATHKSRVETQATGWFRAPRTRTPVPAPRRDVNHRAVPLGGFDGVQTELPLRAE